MDILKLLNSQETLNKLGQSVGASPSQVKDLTSLGIPALLQAMDRNASTPEGASSLAGALEQHQDDNIDDLDGFLSKVDKDDGAKMLQHIFSGSNDRVQNNLAKKTGMKTDQVSGLMTQLAPMLMGALGKQKKQENVDASGISGLLSGLKGQAGGSGIMGIVSNLLDSDDDGSIIDDVGGLLKGFFKK